MHGGSSTMRARVWLYGLWAGLAAVASIVLHYPSNSQALADARPPTLLERGYAPLTGPLLAAEVAAGNCLPFWRPILAHPGWEIHIGMLGSTISITPGGWMSWWGPDDVWRGGDVTSAELAWLHDLDRLDCRPTVANDQVIHVSLTSGEGAPIPASSPLGKALRDLVDRVSARADRQERERIGDFELDVVARGGVRLHVQNGDLTVTRRGKRIADERLSDRTYADLIEWVRRQEDFHYVRDLVVAHGTASYWNRHTGVAIVSDEAWPLATWVPTD